MLKHWTPLWSSIKNVKR